MPGDPGIFFLIKWHNKSRRIR